MKGMNMDDQIIVPVEADLTGFTTAMTDLQKQSQKFGTVFTGTIRSAILSGKSFDETLRGLALKLSGLALNAGLKPLENLFSSAFESLVGGATGGFGGSGVSSVTPFAKGGVVASPTYFGMGSSSSLGLMGEAGAEAIMPLARGADGRLGVQTQSSANGPNIVFNVTTPDVQGFRKSEAQIASMLTRTVSRGRRSL
jgi:phage-related minor tail protein